MSVDMSIAQRKALTPAPNLKGVNPTETRRPEMKTKLLLVTMVTVVAMVASIGVWAGEGNTDSSQGEGPTYAKHARMSMLTPEQHEQVKAKIAEMKEAGASREEVREAVADLLKGWGIERPRVDVSTEYRVGILQQLTPEQREQLQGKTAELREQGASMEQIREAVGDMLQGWGIDAPGVAVGPRSGQPGQPPRWGQQGPPPQWGQQAPAPQGGQPGMAPHWGQQGHRPRWGQEGHRPRWGQQGPAPQWGQQAGPPQWGQPGMAPHWGQQGHGPRWGQQGPPPQWGHPGPPPQWGQQGPAPQWGQQSYGPGWGQPGQPPRWGQQGPPPQWGHPGQPPRWGQQGPAPQRGFGQQGMGMMQQLTPEQREEVQAKMQQMKEAGATREEIHGAVRELFEEWGVEHQPHGPQT